MLSSIEYTDLPEETERYEIKYLCETKKLDLLLDQLKHSFQPITYQGVQTQKYHNLYFDTTENKNYNDHHKGAYPREKIRVRTYFNAGDPTSFLEHKRKYSSGMSEKIREQVAYKNPIFAFAPLIKKVTIEYSRRQFWDANSQERITIDTDLKFTNCQIDNQTLNLEKVTIIEVKKKRLVKSKTDAILKELSLHPESFSKYCIAMALLNSKLKQNNFKQTIRKIEAWSHQY